MDHATIIELWPSLAAFADDLAVQYGTAKAMRRRASIPSQYWLAVVEHANKRGISNVSLEVLALAAATPPTFIAAPAEGVAA